MHALSPTSVAGVTRESVSGRPRIIATLQALSALLSPPSPPPAVTSAQPRLLPALPPPGRKATARALSGSADALALAQCAGDAATRGQMLVAISADALAVQRLAAEIAWFAPTLRVSVLPDWETLPYDHFSPHQDLVSERLAALYHVSRGECDVLLVAATTALYRLAPPSYLAAFTFFLARRRAAALAALARRIPERHASCLTR